MDKLTSIYETMDFAIETIKLENIKSPQIILGVKTLEIQLNKLNEIIQLKYDGSLGKPS